MVRRLDAARGPGDRHQLRRRPDRGCRRRPRGTAIHGHVRVRVGVLRRDPRAFSRADAAVPGGDLRLLPDPRPVQPVRLVRGDERRRLRTDRLSTGGVGADRGAQFHRRQHNRQLSAAERNRLAVRGRRHARLRRARGGGGPPCPRSGDPVCVLPDRYGVPDQGRDGAVSFLAGRGACCGAKPGLRDLLGRYGRARPVRRRAAVLERIRGRRDGGARGGERCCSAWVRRVR